MLGDRDCKLDVVIARAPCHRIFGCHGPMSPRSLSPALFFVDDLFFSDSYFQQSLNDVARKLASGELGPCTHGIAFPWQIGCGIGGGNWKRYSVMLHTFATLVPVPVIIVSPPGTRGPAEPGLRPVIEGALEGGTGAGAGADGGVLWAPGDPVGRICWIIDHKQLLATVSGPPALTVGAAC
jgi:hypothetical protein